MAGTNSINIVATFNGAKAFEGINRLERSFSRLKKIVMTVIAGKVVKEMANFGNQMTLMSERTGMSISRLSALRNAFVSSGAGAKAFEKTISSINDGLLGLSMGRGDFAAKLGMFGISPYTRTGALKTADQVMYDIADWAAKQKGRMSRKDILYRLTSIFGIDDATAIKMLQGGAAMRGSAYAASKRMGLVTDEQAEKLSKLKKKIDEFFGTIHNTFARVIADLEPYLTPILEKLQALVKAAGDNPKVTAAIVGIIAGITTLMSVASALTAVLGPLTTALSGLFFAIELALGGILGWFLGKGAAWLVNLFAGGDAEKRQKIFEKYSKDGRLDIDAAKKSYESLYSKGYGKRTKDEEFEFNTLQGMINAVDPSYLTGKSEQLDLPQAPDVTQARGDVNIGGSTKEIHLTQNFNGKVDEDMVPVIYASTVDAIEEADYERPIDPRKMAQQTQ